MPSARSLKLLLEPFFYFTSPSHHMISFQYLNLSVTTAQILVNPSAAEILKQLFDWLCIHSSPWHPILHSVVSVIL